VSNTNELIGFREKVLSVFKPYPQVLPLENIHLLWVGPKRKKNQTAELSFRTQPLIPRDGFIAAHVKVEKVNVAIGVGAVTNDVQNILAKDPRIIQARSARFNVQLARFIKPDEHRYFRAIDKTFKQFSPEAGRTVMKGMNASRQGEEISKKWANFQNPRAIRVDAKRFDQHVSEMMLKYEHTFYTRALRHKDKCSNKEERALLKTLLKMQLFNTGFANTPDGKIRYTIRGNRMSGDMNTGLGNVIIMTSLMFAFFSEARKRLLVGRRADWPNFRLELVNNGDDCSILCEAVDLEWLTDNLDPFFLRYGVEMEVEGIADKLEHLKFCQCHPVWTPSGYVMVRNCQMAMGKDSINLGLGNTREAYDSWRGAIAGCGLALTAGIPVQQAWYSMIGRGTSCKRTTTLTTGMDYLARGMEASDIAIHPKTRVSFFEAFGVPPDLQVILEKRYDSIRMCYNPDIVACTTGVVGITSYAY